MSRRKDTISFTAQKTHGKQNHLTYETTNPDLVDDTIAARNHHCTYGSLKAQDTLNSQFSVKDHMKHRDLSGYMTVRERMQRKQQTAACQKTKYFKKRVVLC